MIIKIIFAFSVVFINLISLFMELKAYKTDQINILYTKIPYFLSDDKRLLGIIDKGRENTKLFYFLITLFFLLAFYFMDYIIILILDIIIISLIRPFALQKDIDKVRKFKYENTTKTEKRKIIDFDLIENKNRFMVNKIFYLIIFGLYIFSISFAIFKKTYFYSWMWIFLGLSFMISDILMDFSISKRSIKTYTDNSKENILINEKIAKKISSLLFIKSFINAILFLLFVILVIKDPYSIKSFLIFFAAISINIICVIIRYNKIKNDPILKNIDNEFLDDDIEYYTAWGYYNPNDPRIFVDRVYGIGNDLNIARLWGKVYLAFSIIFLFGLLIFTSIIFNTKTHYSYTTENNKIEISSNVFYSDSIELDKIESIKFLEKLPSGRFIRLSGNAMEKTSTGNYRLENYGDVRIYLYNDIKSVVEIKTRDKNFFINENSTKKTKDLYNKLSNFVKNKK